MGVIMRVHSVNVAYAQQQNLTKRKAVSVPRNSEVPETRSEISFGNMKACDYIAGGICGTVMAIVATAALGPIAGGIIGAYAAKTTAEANYESRPSDDDE